MGHRAFRGMVGWLTVAATAVALVAVSSGSAEASFPGQNGRIAFDTVWGFWNGATPSSQIYSVRPDGTGMRRLTDVAPGTAAWHPAFSPNAARISYVVSADGVNDQVWVMRSDGSGQRLLVDEPEWADGDPSFSANGQRVLYSRCGNYVAIYWTCKIVSVRLDGSGMRTVIGGTWHPFGPMASPDGSTIAYDSDAGGYDSRIWLADADGRHQRQIGPNNILMGRLSWSPDGTRLLLTDDRNGGLYTIRVDGTGLALVAPTANFGSWSPDGSRILSKVLGADGNGPLQVTKADGSDPVRIVRASQWPGFSDWGVQQ